MEWRLERIQKMVEAMILEQKEVTKKLLCKMDEISRTWDARLNSCSHHIKHEKENSMSSVEVQCLQQSDNLAIATHDGGVKQCSKVVASLKKIPQINIQKVRVFSYKSKMQSVYFKDKAAISWPPWWEIVHRWSAKNWDEEHGWINGEFSKELQDIIISNYELETEEKANYLKKIYPWEQRYFQGGRNDTNS